MSAAWRKKDHNRTTALSRRGRAEIFMVHQSKLIQHKVGLIHFGIGSGLFRKFRRRVSKAKRSFWRCRHEEDIDVLESLGNFRGKERPSGSHTLVGLCILGMIASLLLVFNIWPCGILVICFLCYLSIISAAISAAQDFSGYHSDGMLLEAGFLSIFFAPSGFRPGWGENSFPSRRRWRR
jgi:hypothetical protein